MSIELESIKEEYEALAEGLKPLEREILEINESHIPLEWQEQPLRYARISRLVARYSAALLKTELDIKELTASLAKDFRINGLPGGVKITEEALRQFIELNPAYRTLQDQRVVLVELESLALGLQKAVEMRERSLKWLSIQIGGLGSTEADVTERMSGQLLKYLKEQKE